MPSTPDVKRILKTLDELSPNPQVALRYSNPLELLVATILSAQCTDERVNQVTPQLFKKYKTASDYARSDLSTLEREIRSTGFYRNKAASLRSLGKALTEKHGGKVPRTMEELVELPGVGRKTANVILGSCFETPGIVVDTHVKRVSFRLGLTRNTDPTKIEQDLMKVIPKQKWSKFSLQLILHGRKICKAPRPLCAVCGLEKLCPKVGVGLKTLKS
jgi:endonuclease III